MPAKLLVLDKKYGFLTPIHEVKSKSRYRKWLFKCDCGNEKEISINSVRRGHSKSCGCLRKKGTHTTHGLSKHPLYRIFNHIKERCYDKNNQDYEDYGSRGILMSDEWKDSFETFYHDMISGYEKGLTIDRIDNDGNYCLENCRWATRKEQMVHTRRNKLLTYKGKTQPICEWSRELKIKSQVIVDRLRLGWSIEKTFETVTRKHTYKSLK